MVECLCNTQEALGSILSTREQREKASERAHQVLVFTHTSFSLGLDDSLVTDPELEKQLSHPSLNNK